MARATHASLQPPAPPLFAAQPSRTLETTQPLAGGMPGLATAAAPSADLAAPLASVAREAAGGEVGVGAPLGAPR